ncbi:hypothetical protein [Photobacterium ganghwense]|uniref:hypothetical protein n=1 Tax=Photobacterium ganghwense TaxID=320778 RepID=UPI0039F0281E
MSGSIARPIPAMARFRALRDAMIAVGMSVFSAVFPVHAAQKLDYVSAVTTPGTGRLVTMDDYWLLAFSDTYDIRLPEHVSNGENLQIRIREDGQWHTENFRVQAISIHHDLCRLHSQHPSRDGRFPTDAIYVQPCQQE